MADNDLADRIAKAQKAHAQRQGTDRDMHASGKGMGIGFRMATELIASVFVGAAIGWGLDQWLRTTPWMLIFWLFLGFAAGIVNVVRVAKAYQADAQGNEGEVRPVEEGREGDT